MAQSGFVSAERRCDLEAFRQLGEDLDCAADIERLRKLCFDIRLCDDVVKRRVLNWNQPVRRHVVLCGEQILCPPDVSAINGIVSLVNILCKRGLLSDADASAMYESMSLPLGLPKYAQNPEVQDIQANLDRLFAVIVEPE